MWPVIVIVNLPIAVIFHINQHHQYSSTADKILSHLFHVTLYFTVESRSTWFDIHVVDSHISQVPVKFCLKFVTVISTDGMSPERKFRNDIIDKINSIGLGVLVVDF